MANWKAAGLAKGIRSIIHLQFTDDLKLYGATKDQFGSLIQALRISSENIKM